MRNKSGSAALRFAEQLAYAALGAAVGVAAGALGGLFGAGVEHLSAFGMKYFQIYVWFLPAAGLFTAAILRMSGRNAALGMRALFEASRGERDVFPLRNAAVQFAGTWCAHLFCASVGREGAGVQIGAAVGGAVGRAVPLRGADRILLVAGMAAGFSALFKTPVGALFFALEVTVVGGLRLRALVASLFASFAAYFTVLLFGFAPAAVPVSFDFALSVPVFFRLFAFGALCGIAGFVFCTARKYMSAFFEAAMPNRFVRAAAAGLLLAALLYLSGGRYSGLGTNLIDAAFAGGSVWYDCLVKLLFTAAFLSVGFVGGEVTTLFAAGACLGASAGGLLGIPVQAAVCLGYVAVFGAATNTLLAPAIIGCELFGGASLPFMAVVCLAAYLFNFGRSVYNQKVQETVGEAVAAGIRRRKKTLLPLPRRLY